MSNYQDTEEAVFIFEGKELTRQMLWLEFEAVLDGFVPLAEQSSQNVTAVYLTVAPGPVVRSAVFFLIQFDAKGYADKRWNLPLEQFSQNSKNGPDLGGGPIKLACRSQCSIAWHKEQLWDPDLDSDGLHFALIKNAIDLNRLHFRTTEDAAQANLRQESAGLGKASRSLDEAELLQQIRGLEQERERGRQQLSEQQLRMSALQQQHLQEIDSSKKELQQRLQQQQIIVDEKNRACDNYHGQVVDLQTQVQGLQQKISGLKEYFEHKISSRNSVDKAAIDALEKHHQITLEEAVSKSRKELSEQLQRRDIELMYRDTQLSGLQAEITRLKQDKQRLLESSGNQLLSNLNKSGVSFVAFEPGAGHMTLSVDSLSDFMENREQFVAEKCGVSLELYQAWRQHFKKPKCVIKDGKGECNAPVQRVERPQEFEPGISDCCQKHRIIHIPRQEASSF